MNEKEPKITYEDALLDFFIDEILMPYLQQEDESCPNTQTKHANEKN